MPISRLLFTTAALAASGLAPLPAATYSIKDLGTLGGTTGYGDALNASGTVVGNSEPIGDAVFHATRYSGTGSNNLDLGQLGGSGSSLANGINASGAIVGSARNISNASHATRFSGTGANNVDLDPGHQLLTSEARAINDAGTIVGWAANAMDNARAARFDGAGGGPTGLGTLGGAESSAYAINAAGTIVGVAATATNVNRATLFSGTGVDADNLDLGVLDDPDASSAANGINAGGQIVGVVTSDGGLSHAVRFSGTGSGNLDLGNLDPASQQGTSALAINDSGQVVGSSGLLSVTQGFLYENGQITNLNDLIAPGSGWDISSATAINNAGQIVVRAFDGAAEHALLLTLIPPPGPTPATRPPRLPPAPRVTITGKKKITTTKAKLIIKGEAAGNVMSITVKVGKAPAQLAKGTAAWSYKTKLKPGKNLITVLAHGLGGDSAPAKLTITRKPGK